MSRSNFIVKLNVASDSECRTIFQSPCRTLKDAEVKFGRIVSGEENYGQFLFPADKFGVFLSISRANGTKVKHMQIN